jgi:exosome complex RNA-binding protein Rrp4
MKNHMIEFYAEPTIGVIIGTNGYIWIEACRRNESLTEVSD